MVASINQVVLALGLQSLSAFYPRARKYRMINLRAQLLNQNKVALSW
jgi:hypothetical protein